MAIKTLCTFKNPILKQKCLPVIQFDDSLEQLIKDMRDTMQYTRGCGLAAPQIGEAKAVIIVQKQYNKGVYAVVNPIITEQSTYTTFASEGCLSYPGMIRGIERPNGVVVKGQTMQGKGIEIHATGFEARIFCHECDHLNGCCKVGG